MNSFPVRLRKFLHNKTNNVHTSPCRGITNEKAHSLRGMRLEFGQFRPAVSSLLSGFPLFTAASLRLRLVITVCLESVFILNSPTLPERTREHLHQLRNREPRLRWGPWRA